MFSWKDLNCEHKDLIHDVAYDWYGHRLATCSSDQYVKIWDMDPDTGEWKLSSSWKTHSGSVWKVTWAHPEFGQILGTCSFDRTAAVWEESPPGTWVRKTNLVDSRTSVTDIKFAPRQYGLLLATCSADGVVRIYEAPDVMNLSQWSLQHEIPCKTTCSCLAWNPSSPKSAPLLAVGSDDSASSSLPKVFIFQYNESHRCWIKVESFSHVSEPVHDLAFAPNVGRSYNILAVASKDLQIITLKPNNESGYEVRLAGQYDDHGSTVWRVCWNVTGTILASSGDDGYVRLWKCNYLDNWRCVAILKGDVNKRAIPNFKSNNMKL
ncbi:nucleoporin SEH1 [Lepeophtheirus salmonis]|uniref:nucleoporin SEH1 n=1 Tax=Lepeophtheirus salmonis TaxID=72036 RepID=UPI001AE5C991|nr:nucleoporin SEH1-like [Lepeophtheirus salmonis]